ncbi:uncharacterized protein BJ212DRAFT_1400422 [Suillus subaureus]|uniref:Uncharacterized protein n=1 Tax=Suillus subaureus TaxID=48587 RepID=A0A9P7J396_9AGAM|nr:uncharacterized protein BJ212DRAFT_1400422 [Suillus subaureus]KAG1800531.1 hypothetical protein BJ212DRAFT_1400422 [Suillus subaureus]
MDLTRGRGRKSWKARRGRKRELRSHSIRLAFMSPTQDWCIVCISLLLFPPVFILFSLDRADTQPTRCHWEQIGQRKMLRGTKAGNGAWALAWVDTHIELPTPEEADPYAQTRAEILEAVRETC